MKSKGRYSGGIQKRGIPIGTEWIREPAVAGTWYPNHPEELAQSILGYLQPVKRVDGLPLALIVPHAGYRYSGSVAAHGFKQLENGKINTAVVIASDHQPPLSDPISIWAKGGYETPHGVIPVNEGLAERLLAHHPRIRFEPQTHSGEHPIEIELPFLEQVCGEFQILPIMVGHADEAAERALAEALLAELPEQGAVIVASSDLSHYPNYEVAKQVDEATLFAIESGDPDQFRRSIRDSMNRGFSDLATCACGEVPIRIAMRVAKGRGADAITRLHYANSGDVPMGDQKRVVGYAAVMFWHYVPPELAENQKRDLLKIAREAVEHFVRTGSTPQEPTADPDFEKLSAVFVTVRSSGELRGCIGQVKADTPLVQAIREKAIAAATGDPRFPPVDDAELSQLTYQISILSPMKRVMSQQDIEVGTHGVAVHRGAHRALLLPKVAQDRSWTREDLMDALFAKALLPRGDWKDLAGIYQFTTVEIEEN